jgi:hypothetical protein
MSSNHFAFFFHASQRAFLEAHLLASRSWRLMLASWLVSGLLFMFKEYHQGSFLQAFFSENRTFLALA